MRSIVDWPTLARRSRGTTQRESGLSQSWNVFSVGVSDLSESELHVLRCLAAAGRPELEMPELLGATKLTKPTLHRIVHSLDGEGFVEIPTDRSTERGRGKRGRPALVVRLAAKGRDELVAHHQQLTKETEALGALVAKLHP